MHKTILIAEDYDDARSFMKFLLESYGYEVIEAADGLQAVETIKDHLPDLILMDISMPVMDGLAATEAIRKIRLGANIPIIAVTAFGSEFHRRAIAAGCDGVIEKPVDLDALSAVLNKYFH